MSTHADSSQRLPGRGGSIVLALVVTLILVVAAEVVLRLVFPIPYSMDIQYLLDGHLGWRLEPNHVYTLAEGGVCSVNNLGFRNATDTVVPKPDGVVRVVVLGGSATFCYEVDDADAWTAILEKRLREKYGPYVEVVNAGVPGYDAFISKINYMYRIRPLEPDILMVSHTWNDLKRFRTIESGAFPQAVVLGKPNPVRKFLRHFQLAWRVRALWWHFFRGDQRENTWDVGPGPSTIPPGGKAHRWARTNFDDIALLAQEDGVLPVFCSQAGVLSPEDVKDPEVRAMVRNDYAGLSVDGVLNQWLAMTKIISESAWDNGVLFIDVYGNVPHDPALFHDHVHLRRGGDERVADVTFEKLVADPAADAVLRKATLR